jgi:hypothetical protein
MEVQHNREAINTTIQWFGSPPPPPALLTQLPGFRTYKPRTGPTVSTLCFCHVLIAYQWNDILAASTQRGLILSVKQRQATPHGSPSYVSILPRRSTPSPPGGAHTYAEVVHRPQLEKALPTRWQLRKIPSWEPARSSTERAPCNLSLPCYRFPRMNAVGAHPVSPLAGPHWADDRLVLPRAMSGCSGTGRFCRANPDAVYVENRERVVCLALPTQVS